MMRVIMIVVGGLILFFVLSQVVFSAEYVGIFDKANEDIALPLFLLCSGVALLIFFALLMRGRRDEGMEGVLS